MRINLNITAGPHKGRAFSFVGHDTFVVGRSKRAHFQLPAKDRYFSRIHFLVEVNPPHCRLMDMGSRNGTYVNGQKVTRADLHDGDRIRAGHTLLRISVDETEAAPAPDVMNLMSASLLPDKPRAAVLPLPRRPATVPPPEAAAVPSEVPSPEPAPAVCLACATPFENSWALLGSLAAHPPRLCTACEAAARKQPQPIPGYRIVRELGRGGMGVVYLAVSTATAGVVAVKTIVPAVTATKDVLVRFFREACILKELQHPNIVSFHDMGEAKGQLFFAMDYVPGIDGARLLKRDGPLEVGRAVGLVAQLLEALAYAHGKGFVHRDVKPHNMLVTEGQGSEAVKLADFGLARVYQTSQLSGLSLMGQVGGTVAFMAPEQITSFRDVKPQADQYSAAATLYALLTGRYAFDLPQSEERALLMILEGQPVPIQARRPDIPGPLADAIHRALARSPEKRFADVAGLRKALLRSCR